jgi:hypothetical protein
MPELVETAWRLLLASRRKRGRIPALPQFRNGGALVDIADRDALYHAMEVASARRENVVVYAADGDSQCRRSGRQAH